jgi:hypothetical protein
MRTARRLRTSDRREAPLTRDELVAGLVRIGELEINGHGQEEVDAYFSPAFTFHGPDGSQRDYEGLQSYFPRAPRRL